MASYSTSTQKRAWTFTLAALQEARANRHSQALQLVQNAEPSIAVPGRQDSNDTRTQQAGMKRPREEDAVQSVSKRARLDADVAGSEANAYMSNDEEEQLLSWCRLELLRLCKEADFDRAITAAAVMFHQRFFVRGLLAQYPPQEMITPAIFLGIKAEACPYTEFEKLSRRLSRFDADLRARVHALMLSHGVTALEDRASASAVTAGSESDEYAEGEEESSPWHLCHEVPLLLGLQGHTVTHQPYRPLKTLLLDCISDYAAMTAAEDVARRIEAAQGSRQRITVPFPAQGSSLGYQKLQPTDATFGPAWDAVQARAFQFADAALLSDAPLRFSPAHIACAALLLACRAAAVYSTPVILPAPGTEALGGGVAGIGERGEGEQVTGSAQAHGGGLHTLLPALASPPPPSVSWWVDKWVGQLLAHGPSTGGGGGGSRGGGGSGTGQQPAAIVNECVEMVDAALRSVSLLHTTGPSLLCRLESVRDSSLVPGTPAHEARLASLKAAREAYKRGKEERGKAAREAYEKAVLQDRQAAGVHAPVLLPVGQDKARDAAGAGAASGAGAGTSA